MHAVQSYAEGRWHTGTGDAREVYHAVTGEPVATVSSEGLDFGAMLRYGRETGGPALRAMTFHERALMLKALAKHLMSKKEVFYEASRASGATKTDAWVDVDGGFGTFFVYSSKGRRELPNERFLLDGDLEQLSRGGTFVGHHLLVPLEGVAVHINAFNFPCWGMMEKLAPTFLAGMPAIVKPASVTSYVTEAVVREIIASGILPEGALQLISGGVGDLFDHLTGQDVVTFTGSAETGRKLKAHPAIIDNSVRFNMEADSLNFSMLGPDAAPGTDAFKLFVREVSNEMRIKTGQRCTAIRRAFVPREHVDAVAEALRERLGRVVVGDPANEDVKMGPLVSQGQRDEVRRAVERLKAESEVLIGGDGASMELAGADAEKGAFHPATVLYCAEPLRATAPHEVEAFGPVTTLMPYDSLDEAVELAKMGKGSLVGSLVTTDPAVAQHVVLGAASHHGRILVLDPACSKESTGHGSPLPHLVHGGPGRAGGGEEMGGIRGVKHFMQRCAIQGSPTMLMKIANEYMVGAERPESAIHPFRKTFDELEIGETLTTHRRTLTEADIVNFAGISGDYFYAHMDELAAKESEIFEGRVAHGYFVLSAAAGLFVHPAPGPVLANYGLEDLRFTKPVRPGDTIQAKLTVKRKIAKEAREGETPNGVVEWHVDVTDQEGELCATYTILTLVRREADAAPAVGGDGAAG